MPFVSSFNEPHFGQLTFLGEYTRFENYAQSGVF